MILYGSLPIDTRVERELRILVNRNFNVTVLDTDIGYGEWKGYAGARRIPLLSFPYEKRQSIGGLLKFWYVCFRYLWKNRQNIDVIHAHDLTGLLPSWIVSTLNRRIKFIYDSHELFPEMSGDRLSFFHYIFFLTIEKICARRIDYLISVSPVILRKIARRVGGTPVLLMNVPDLKRVREKFGQIPCWFPSTNPNIRKIVYSGGVRHRRGYDELVQAAEILTNNTIYKYEFWIVGDGPYLEHVKSLVDSHNLTDVFVFSGRVEFEKLLEITSTCDIAVALYSDPMAHLGMSNKIFEYMMLGMPFLYPHAKQSLPILNQINAVILDNPIGVDNLVDSIKSIFADRERMSFISENGRRLVMERFNWEFESKKLIRIYDEMFQITS